MTPLGLRIHLAEEWHQDAVAIYVVAGRPVDRILHIIPGDPAFGDAMLLRWDELNPENGSINISAPPIGPAGTIDPTLRLPTEVLDAIVDARAQVRPADTGATEALNDTRTVRDRLLNLIELTIQRQPTTATLETTLEPVKWEGWPHRDPPPA